MFQSAINSFRRGGFRGNNSSTSNWKRRPEKQHVDTGEEFIVGTIEPSTPSVQDGTMGPPRVIPITASAPPAPASATEQPSKKTKLGENLADVRILTDFDVRPTAL